eukprot:5837703-Alexandrium_andersonii.AAC.1
MVSSGADASADYLHVLRDLSRLPLATLQSDLHIWARHRQHSYTLPGLPADLHQDDSVARLLQRMVAANAFAYADTGAALRVSNPSPDIALLQRLQALGHVDMLVAGHDHQMWILTEQGLRELLRCR